ncbi:hypothetical protein [Mycetocola saprophilus]|uniref:hypothetical protein n=1 Tax=Mycetocola saprophilus TaxID=76636 RepID=UPI003BF42E51
MIQDPDEVLAGIDEDVRRAERRMAAQAQLVETMGQLRGIATDRGRDITVEVDTSGAITNLKLTDRATALGGTKLAPEILRVVADARGNLQEQMLASAQELLGEDDPALGALRAEVEDHRERQERAAGFHGEGLRVDGPRLGGPSQGGPRLGGPR